MKSHRKLYAVLIIIFLAIADRVLPTELFYGVCVGLGVIGVAVWVRSKKKAGKKTWLNSVLRMILGAMSLDFIALVFFAIEFFYYSKYVIGFFVTVIVSVGLLVLYYYAKNRFGVIDLVPKSDIIKDGSLFPWISVLGELTKDKQVLNDRAIKEAKKKHVKERKSDDNNFSVDLLCCACLDFAQVEK